MLFRIIFKLILSAMVCLSDIIDMLNNGNLKKILLNSFNTQFDAMCVLLRGYIQP